MTGRDKNAPQIDLHLLSDLMAGLSLVVLFVAVLALPHLF